MKKVVITLFAFVLVASMFAFVSAVDNSTDNSTTNSSVEISGEGFEKSFNCLSNALKSDCSGATTIEELSLAILASTDVSDKCLTKLLDKKQSKNCWGTSSCTVKETALAVLALNHAGQNTELAEEWILSKNMTSSDLIWYLQQDSKEKAECKFTYNSSGKNTEANVQVYDNKKISGSAGPCLSLAQGSFWLQVAPSCYNSDFRVTCDKDFIATLLYQQKNSQTLYILSDTVSAPKFETITLSPKSFCFGDSTSCSYSATVWASLALLRTGHDVESFVPYIIAMEETNKPLLPKAFSYIVTEENEYALQLIEQKGGLNDFWLAESSANDKFYDTALAYLSVSGVSSEVDNNVRGWLELNQNQNGCWEGSAKSLVKDTAMVLWALEGKSFSGNAEVVPTTRCREAGFWCMTQAECVLGQDVSENYFCEGLTKDTCCTNSNLKDCSELSGQICKTGFVCDAGSQDSNQGSCCLGECIEEPTDSQCEQEGYFCKSSCSATQVEKDFSCNDAGVCCGASGAKAKSSAWIWILVLLIIAVIAAICWIKREQLKLWWFKMKTKFRKDKGRPSSTSNSGMPPKPGFPPIRNPQMMRRPMPPRSPVSAPARGQLDDVFKKLNDMSK